VTSAPRVSGSQPRKHWRPPANAGAAMAVAKSEGDARVNLRRLAGFSSEGTGGGVMRNLRQSGVAKRSLAAS